MSECGFSKHHYRAILGRLRTDNYAFIHYNEYDESDSRRVVILRHDIDQSVAYAYEIAVLEAELGARSTFFVWVSSPFYNVFDPEISGMLKEMAGMGHAVGLHFDPTAYTAGDICTKISDEAGLLSFSTGSKVDTFSFHRPAPALLDRDIRIDGMISAYAPVFRFGFKYLSDSNHHWREGCACGHIVRGGHERLHLLTHAVWWVSDNELSQQAKLDRFMNDTVMRIRAGLAHNVKGFAYGGSAFGREHVSG